MKLKRIEIANFKGIRRFEWDFAKENGAARSLSALIGDNGSGKTTVLQAIALTLSLATRRTKSPLDFAWPGFLISRLSTIGPAFVRLIVAFDDEEIQATRELYEMWKRFLSPEFIQSHKIVPPSDRGEVTLEYRNGAVSSPDGFEAKMQFMGRYYIKCLLDTQPDLRSKFRYCGDVFWFDQYRNIVSGPNNGNHAENGNKSNESSREASVENIRKYLVGWWMYRFTKNKSGQDYLASLEPLFQRIFPGTAFSGISMKEHGKPEIFDDYYFLISRNDLEFDISEMSSGEQSVFPLLYEFVRLEIARSIILIDELELHLHPPQQQALLSALPKMRPDCQFIITTHSPYLESSIPDENEKVLRGGTLCL